jgi:hypothetical protein
MEGAPLTDDIYTWINSLIRCTLEIVQGDRATRQKGDILAGIGLARLPVCNSGWKIQNFPVPQKIALKTRSNYSSR